MTETIEDPRARAEIAEATLGAIRAAIADWMHPDNGLDDRDLILVPTIHGAGSFRRASGDGPRVAVLDSN